MISPNLEHKTQPNFLKKCFLFHRKTLILTSLFSALTWQWKKPTCLFMVKTTLERPYFLFIKPYSSYCSLWNFLSPTRSLFSFPSFRPLWPCRFYKMPQNTLAILLYSRHAMGTKYNYLFLSYLTVWGFNEPWRSCFLLSQGH